MISRPDPEDICTSCQHTRGWHGDCGCDKGSCDCAGFNDRAPEPYVPDEQDFDDGGGK